MQTCPDCNKIFRGYKCGCGYKKPFALTKTGGALIPTNSPHPDSLKCIWHENGQRCQKLGTMSTFTNAGHIDKDNPAENRPFYCPWHYEHIVYPDFASDKIAQENYFLHKSRYKNEINLKKIN